MESKKDKLRMDLVPFEFGEELAKVMSFGVEKYAENTWITEKRYYNDYIGAYKRHLLKFEKGVNLYPESNLHHLAHAANNILMILYFEINKDHPNNKSIDNRLYKESTPF